MQNNVIPAEKTLEFIVYVGYRLKQLADYDTNLLANSLFLVDYMNYHKNGKPISDLNYVKATDGIIPSPERFFQIKNVLLKKGDLDATNRGEFIIRRAPNHIFFDKDEIQLMEEVFNAIFKNGFNISEHNKALLAWKHSVNNDEIPYYTYQYSPKTIQPEDFAYAKNMVKE